MLGVFAKVVRGETVKSRLQTALTRQEAERFHVASLADTLETALRLAPAPSLFLQATTDESIEDLRARLGDCGLDTSNWSVLRIHRQCDGDLGMRLEHAFATLAAVPGAPGPALIIGADSPSLPAARIRTGMERLGLGRRGLGRLGLADAGEEDEGSLEESAHPGPRAGSADQRQDSAAANRPDAPPDLVLGPTNDGGYWGIGLRRQRPGLLRDIAWSSNHTCADTLARAAAFGLRAELLLPWTDVDHPADLRELARQIAGFRQSGDTRTARHSERFLAAIGVHHT